MRFMPALRLPRLLVFALALLLVGGQQAALAHMVGHLASPGGAAVQAVAQQGDDDHGAALTLSHVCTTCLALDSFAAPLPSLPRLLFAEGAAAVPPVPTFSGHIAILPRRYAARAPPSLL
jgi:hypothetical protein